MIIFRNSTGLQSWREKQRENDRPVAFIPTMGALHEGHIQLIEASRAFTGLSICSIFINPAQFNNPSDFEKYPVSTENDIRMLDGISTDVLFLPSKEEIYPGGSTGLETYDLGSLENILEGKYRPGHFHGVCLIMNRLLKLIKPDHLLMGQKDYQQCLVVQKLISTLGISLNFHAIPTVRESDGLAMSSRNRRLDPEQRRKAPAIYRALKDIAVNIRPGSTEPPLLQARRLLDAADFRTDYVSVARASDLEPVGIWDGKEKIVALIAAFLGEIRLIDNLPLN